MDTLQSVAYGFSVLLTPTNLFYCFISVLPGLGPAATIAMLLPLTFHAPPLASFIMLSGICYGTQYGGSTTSILLNMPGETASVVTCLDGYQMALPGLLWVWLPLVLLLAEQQVLSA